jgi:hypothetical protein
VRPKADTFQVENPGKAMKNFRSLLGRLLKVPKSEIGTREQRAKSGVKRKRKT